MRSFKSAFSLPKKVIFESLKAIEDVTVSAFPGVAGLLTGAITPDDFIEHMAQPVVVDARRIFDPQRFRDRLRYSAVGLGDDVV